MGPSRTKGHPPRIQDLFGHWIFQAVAAILNILLNGDRDGPPAIRCMLQMFFHGIVIFFPAVEITLAEVACRVIRAGRRRLVEETGSRELTMSVSRISVWEARAYLRRRRVLVRPFESLYAFSIGGPLPRSLMRCIERGKTRRIALH